MEKKKKPWEKPGSVLLWPTKEQCDSGALQKKLGRNIKSICPFPSAALWRYLSGSLSGHRKISFSVSAI